MASIELLRNNVVALQELIVNESSLFFPFFPLLCSEAGRGCVLGSMVYGCAYWSMDVDESIPKGFRDSKQMKEEGKLVRSLLCLMLMLLTLTLMFLIDSNIKVFIYSISYL